MPYVTKSWGNDPPGGTPLNATGLNDWESRISAATNNGVNNTGAIYAWDYGVRSDAVTPSAAFLQNAIDAAKLGAYGAVILPSGQTSGRIKMETSVNVPDGIAIIGTSRRGTVFDAIPGTFPTSTAMFNLGTTADNFDVRLMHLGIDMKDIAGSIGVHAAVNIEEGSGLFNVGIYNFKVYGALFEHCQNFMLRDLEFYGSPSGGATSALRLFDCGPFSVEWATLNTFNSGVSGFGLDMQDCYAGNVLRQIHTEQNLVGIDVKSSQVAIIGMHGNSPNPTCVHFDSGSFGCSVIGLNTGGSTNAIIDDVNGATIPSSALSQVAFYSQRFTIPGASVWSLSYSAAPAPQTHNSQFQKMSITNGTAMTFDVPSLSVQGMTLTLDINNSSGGAHGAINANAIYKLAGGGTVVWAGATIANGKRRTISFYFDGSNWIETARTAADI